jgi:DNA-directed RNA polymerase specialized sigma24 family protein
VGDGPVRRPGGEERARRSPDQALDVLYKSHYRPLTQLATLLAGGDQAAEEIVQEAFVAMHSGWTKLSDDEQAVLYLLRTIVRGCRSRPARAGRARQAGAAQSCLIDALDALPGEQREAVLLSCVADLPETRIAAVMGIKSRAVRVHLASGLQSLAGTAPGLLG